MQTKLSYALYVYSQMHETRMKGGAIVRHPLFEFPYDDNIVNLNEIDKNQDLTYMLGDAIFVVPAFEGKEEDTYSAYFPEGTWVNLNNYAQIVMSHGNMVEGIPRNPSYVNAYLRPGKVIPYQQNTGLQKTPADFAANLKTTLIINRKNGYADGTVYIDDGLTLTSKYN